MENMDWDSSKLEELAQMVVKYELTEVEIRDGDSRITIKKTPAAIQMISSSQGIPVTGIQAGVNTDFMRITERKALQDEIENTKAVRKGETSVKTVPGTENLKKYVTSPIAGIFYRQSQPGIPPYAEIGQKVKKGDIICLVEAMKMINEIAADRNGVVKEFLAKNEQFVEYGAPLVLIEEE